MRVNYQKREIITQFSVAGGSQEDWANFSNDILDALIDMGAPLEMREINMVRLPTELCELTRRGFRILFAPTTLKDLRLSLKILVSIDGR